MKDLKIKGGSFDMAGAAVAGAYRNVRICYRQRRWRRGYLYKKREERRFDEQYFRCWYRAF
jgi:hypothetical protein